MLRGHSAPAPRRGSPLRIFGPKESGFGENGSIVMLAGFAPMRAPLYEHDDGFG